MIFVTVGSHYQGFERLIKKMDELAVGFDEKVIMQIGHTKYMPKNAEYFEFRDNFEEIKKLNREARLVVSHAGVGSIITALEQKTPILIVPRLKALGEHIDDHQLEIAKKMSKTLNVVPVFNIDDLNFQIRIDIDFVDRSMSNTLVNALKNYLYNL